jgi:hypothetical protein
LSLTKVTGWPSLLTKVTDSPLSLTKVTGCPAAGLGFDAASNAAPNSVFGMACG